MNIAIIPARGGSKRLPGKNIKLLAGKPMITWTIEAALESGVFDHVFVSTESESIADVSRQAGATVPGLRPDELSKDTATSNDVITHMVELVENQWGTVTAVTLLQPTSPLRNAQNIREAYQIYIDKQAKSVVSVCQLEHPIQFCNRLPADLCLHNFIRTENNKRVQDLEPYYLINGAIYIFERQLVGRLKDIYCKRSFAYVMNAYESVDIDVQFDFDFAEFIFRKYS
ncbi:acylneuraminate cytidylyltransferase family protein [Oceanisphaera arctica]|uniref:CMP-N-acetylneuraminic acid synthetase n=1 Tax=Oceanisphaera arctica TaxID=641510 RepID=A0A2P5TKF6_9GAMM|nr:acylneuraminate cytidylyltransferase family protein [Oceanisphaera arctica]PPL15527.1 CMP-N-acetylneuraminic acid synthetase [Oceanisphaera arctica]GHA27656.1 hypothetical protein GCM10007082_29840 [Oceanisphaera arctica]